MSLTGGLWFSLATFDLTDQARDSLLFFGAVADAVLIFGLSAQERTEGFLSPDSNLGRPCAHRATGSGARRLALCRGAV